MLQHLSAVAHCHAFARCRPSIKLHWDALGRSRQIPCACCIAQVCTFPVLGAGNCCTRLASTPSIHVVVGSASVMPSATTQSLRFLLACPRTASMCTPMPWPASSHETVKLLLAPPLAYPPHAPPSAQPLSGFYLAYLASNSGDMPFRFVVELLGDFCGLYYFTNVLLQLSIAGGALTGAGGLGLWGVGGGRGGQSGTCCRNLCHRVERSAWKTVQAKCCS